MYRLTFLCLFMLAFVPTSVRAQQVPTDPTSTHIFPAGGRRGTSVPVRVGGECLPPRTHWQLFGEGVTAPPILGERAVSRDEPSPRRKPQEIQVTYPKEWQSTIEIADDAPLGSKYWRLSCARGGTGARPFVVGDMPEFIETEPNSQPATAESLTLPVTLNGQISGERDMDYFRFTAQAGEIISADVMAARLGSPLEALVEIHDASGERLPVQEARAGCDPVLAFRVPTTGEYRLIVTNLTYRGGPDHVYRITLSAAPHVMAAFPSGWQAGQSRELELFTLTGASTPEVFRHTLAFPMDKHGEFNFHRAGNANPLSLDAGDVPEVVEQEPNDATTVAQEVSWPTTINGRFATAADEDWFAFTARQGVLFAIDCKPFPRDTAALPVLTVTDEAGKTLAQSSAVTDTERIARLEWRAPADGRFRLRIRDLQQHARGGWDFIYRLSLREAVPDFTLSLPVDAFNCLQGAKADLDLQVRRHGGFSDPIDLTVEGLPAGVTVEPKQVPAGAATVKLAFTVEPDVRSAASTLRINGRAMIAGKPVDRVTQTRHLGRDADGVTIGSPMLDHVQLTVQHKPTFKLHCNEAYQYAYRGTLYPYLMEVERLDGFDGPITLQMADRQNKDLDSIEIRELTIPPGQSQVMLPIYLPETMHINVQAHSNVYAQGFVTFKDRWGDEQSQLVVSTMRCMIRTLPPVAKLKSVEREVVWQSDGSVECRLVLDRTANFSGSMRVELTNPPLSSQFTAEPVTIREGQSTATLTVRHHSGGSPSVAVLRFRGVGDLSDGAQVVSEATVIVK
ncbi:MAG: hypothetical protein HZA46_21690 [Planctomycetales bacterium]|nr:hypothetical protein [Planctomycetales bacterium]